MEKISKREAKITARLYIASMFLHADSFSIVDKISHETNPSLIKINIAVQDEIDKIILKLRKGSDDIADLTSCDCILEAKRIIQERKG